MSQPILQVEHLALTYQTPTEETKAIRDVDFSVQPGEFVSIIGPSGCGKSTLLSCMAGLHPPTAGRVLLEGRPVTAPHPKVGYMLQTDNLLPWRSIRKNVTLGLEIRHALTPESRGYAEELLRKYGLWDFRNTVPARLSGGMRQRAALIRTLALRPRILLLDEAFSALDYQTRIRVTEDVYGILRQERQTLVMVTHDIPEALAMSDRVLILSERPSVVQRELTLDYGIEDRSPVKVRESPRFSGYFNTVWREL